MSEASSSSDPITAEEKSVLIDLWYRMAKVLFKVKVFITLMHRRGEELSMSSSNVDQIVKASYALSSVSDIELFPSWQIESTRREMRIEQDH